MALKSKNNNGMFNNLGNRSDYQMVDKVFGNSEQLNKSNISYNEVLLDEITPRPINNYSQTRIDRLAESIVSTNGRLIHPIVIVRPQDLREDSEILKKYKSDGVDISSIKYVIVAGERRYRAFRLNRDKKQQELDAKGSSALNPYNTITANILTKEEAKNEEVYYKDSNDQARQLTPIEGILHIKDITAGISSNEDKRNCLIEMYGEDKVVKDPDVAAKEFRMDRYILFYLSKELGIEGWTESTVRAYLRVVNGCDEEVVKAVLDKRFPATEARKISNLPNETQIKLLKIFENNPDNYRRVYKEISEKPEKEKSFGKSDIKKKLKKLSKDIDGINSFIDGVLDELGKSDRNNTEKIKNRLLDLQKAIREYTEF